MHTSQHFNMRILHHRRRCRGVAMLVVLLAVALATVLGMAFMMAQGTASGIAQNLQDKAIARQIAESGMEIVRQQILSHEDWRSSVSQGRWITDQELGQGTFSVDWQDDTQQGDSSDERFILTVVGRYASAAHVIRCNVTPIRTQSEGESSGGGDVSAVPVAVAQNIYLWGNSQIDAYASANGPYSASNRSDSAVLGTNGTTSQIVQMSDNAQIKGQLLIGPGATASQAVASWGNSKILGGISTLTAATTMPTVEMPSGAPSSSGQLGLWSGSLTISENKRYSAMQIGNAAQVTIDGNLTIWCEGGFMITGTAQFIIPEGSSLKLYVKGSVNVHGTSQFNPATEAPGRLQIFIIGNNNHLQLTDASHCSAYVVNPGGPLYVYGTSQFYGRYTGKSLTMSDSARIHMDTLGAGTGSGSTPGEQTPGESTISYLFRWNEEL